MTVGVVISNAVDYTRFHTPIISGRRPRSISSVMDYETPKITTKAMRARRDELWFMMLSWWSPVLLVPMLVTFSVPD